MESEILKKAQTFARDVYDHAIRSRLDSDDETIIDTSVAFVVHELAILLSGNDDSEEVARGISKRLAGYFEE